MAKRRKAKAAKKKTARKTSRKKRTPPPAANGRPSVPGRDRTFGDFRLRHGEVCHVSTFKRSGFAICEVAVASSERWWFYRFVLWTKRAGAPLRINWSDRSDNLR